MPHDLRQSLRDMQRFIGELQRFIAGKSLIDLQTDELLRRAVEREFILFGEVIRRIEGVSGEASERITHIRAITGFRNVLVHRYDHTDLESVWDMSTMDVPLLKHEIDEWATELGMPPFESNQIQ